MVHLPKFVEKLFFNKGVYKQSDPFGEGRQAICFPETMLSFFTQTCFWQKYSLPRILATLVKLPNISWVQDNMFFLATIANLATN